MAPLVRNGDILIILPVTSLSSHIEFGDVVVFYKNNIMFVHRVIGKTKNNKGNTVFLIQGDSTAIADGVIPESCVHGRLTTIERDGRKIHMTSLIMKILGFMAAFHSRYSITHGWQVLPLLKKMPVLNHYLA